MAEKSSDLPPWAADYNPHEDVSGVTSEELKKLPPLYSPLSLDELKQARTMAILDGVAWGTCGGLLAMQISKWMRVGQPLVWATLAITAPTAGTYMWWISREPRIRRQERDRIIRQNKYATQLEQQERSGALLEPVAPAFESVKPMKWPGRERREDR